MTLTLSAREQQMLAAVITEMGDMPSVDFNKIALVTGQKYGKNARSAFVRIWTKLKAGAVPTEDSVTSTKKGRAKATPKEKKTVGKTATPRRASAKKPTSRRKVKKEESVPEEKKLNVESEKEEDSSEVSEAENVTRNNDEDEDELNETEKALRAEMRAIDAKNPADVTEDEYGARLLGISLKEFQELAENGEIDHPFKSSTPISRAPTPKIDTLSEDEA